MVIVAGSEANMTVAYAGSVLAAEMTASEEFDLIGQSEFIFVLYLRTSFYFS